MNFACVSRSYPVGARGEKTIPIMSSKDLVIMSQRFGYCSLEDLWINRNLSQMLSHLTIICGEDGVNKFSAMLAA